MSVRCGDCNNYKQIDEKTGEGICEVTKERVLDITPAKKKEGCKLNCKY